MNREPLDCADVRRSFVEGLVPSGPELEAHVRTCAECRELLDNDAELGRSLGQAVLPAPDPGELFALIERDVARDVGLRARLRALPTGLRSAILVLAAGLLLVSHLVLWPRRNLLAYSPVVFAGALSLLGLAIVLGARALLRGPSAPLRAARVERLLAPGLLAVPALAALLAPLGSSEAAALWGSPGNCFVYGALLTVPMVLLYRLLERRDAPPATALLAAGALAGATANLLLHAHCPSAHPGHLLLGHVSIGAAWAAALWLLRPAQLER